MSQTEEHKSHPPRPGAGHSQLARTFLRISLLGFGGPNAHLALMLDEVVERKGWITREHFLHLMGVTNLLPGPNSSEVAIHIGYTQRGWRGALTTGLAFLSPTLFLVTLFSAVYFRYGATPAAAGIFWGLKPVVLAVILAAGWKLAKAALSTDRASPGDQDATAQKPTKRVSPGVLRAVLIVLALGGAAAAVLGDRMEVPAMILGGVISWLLLRGGPRARRSAGLGAAVVPASKIGAASAGAGLQTPQASSAFSWTSWGAPVASMGGWLAAAYAAVGPLGQIFLLMAGAGAVLFGGGYMLVALLEPFVVESLGWLTPHQFLDGIALTQAVPGPIVTLVAFVGYGVAGVPGAIVATAGIYLPSFAAVLAVAPHLERWRKAEGFRDALRGVNAVVAGAIMGVGVTLLPPAVPDLFAGSVFIVALACLARLKIPAVWVMAGGLAVGVVRTIVIG